jgi:isopropylmalate/homocitrate/citramalate synthase
LREAQRQYSDLLSRAQGGDADAIGQLSGAADAYLQASKDYYGSGTQYANVFDGVKKAMESIGSMNVADPDSIQARIDVLRESQSKELQALRDAAKDQIDALRDANKAQIESIKAATAAQTKQIQDSAQEQIKNLTDIEKNAAIKDLRDKTIIELQNLYELSEKIDAAAKLRQSEMDQVARDNLKAAQESASYLATLAGASGSISGGQGGATDTSTGLNSTMQTVATETKASVTIQREAFPKMLERLGELSERLAKIERNQRLTA